MTTTPVGTERLIHKESEDSMYKDPLAREMYMHRLLGLVENGDRIPFQLGPTFLVVRSDTDLHEGSSHIVRSLTVGLVSLSWLMKW